MSREDELKYTTEHEWIEAADSVATVGITSYAAGKLGDVVYVDLPAVGTVVEAGRVIGEIESTKSVGELYAPVSGTITEVNDAVVDSPELVNSDPLGEGWLVKVEYVELPSLLELAEYTAFTAES
ncbi:glycine cleavage system protein GcvH [Naasia lichenicola]|uniref:Glycine cleavage system H protein n=1 Tax=Naasia lichenicola TaxID=2565933 RepID=A0A4S4FE97_9MICO|nr:glycine cleavage system protein GcvH [Naasia lichenicola]THG28459.1 glycine cleavage system protein GcvH [Naasia lichenicola]